MLLRPDVKAHPEYGWKWPLNFERRMEKTQDLSLECPLTSVVVVCLRHSDRALILPSGLAGDE